MLAELPLLDDLPRQNASQVKNKWGEVVRLVREKGSVAVTNHACVDMVLLDVARYRQLSEELQTLKAREQVALDALEQRFDDRLAVLQQANAPRKITALLAAKGKLSKKPRVGASF